MERKRINNIQLLVICQTNVILIIKSVPKKEKQQITITKKKKILHNQLKSVTKGNLLPQPGISEITNIQNYSIF